MLINEKDPHWVFSIPHKNKKTIASVIDFLDKNQQYFYFDEKVLYFLYKATYLTDINLLNEAECFLIRASEMTENKKYLSLIYAQLGMVYTKNNKTDLAIKYYIDAKTLFDSNMNYVRSLYICSNIAIAYIYSEAYKEAIHACEECMSIAKRLGMNKIIMISAYNLSYIYMLIGEYEKVNTHVLVSLQNGEPENGIYFHSAYAYYKLGMVDSCKYWIEEGRSKLLKTENLMSYSYDYLESQLEQSYGKSIDILKNIIGAKDFDESLNKIVDFS